MTQITANEFADIAATTFMILCGKERTRELMRLSIDKLRSNACHTDGAHPLLEYAVALKDVVSERNRPDEIEAMVVVVRQVAVLGRSKETRPFGPVPRQ